MTTIPRGSYGDTFGDSEGGYGDPFGSGETGYGDPPAPARPSIVAPGLPDPDGRPMLSDEGGYVVELWGPWTTRGPYRVKLIDADGETWPLNQDGAPGLAPGRGIDVYTDGSMRRLRFAWVSVPVGLYSIRVESGIGLLIAEVADAVRVVARGRPWPEGYALARAFGTAFDTGPLSPELEPAPSADNRPPYPALEGIVRAFARTLRTLSGRPCTRLASDATEGDEDLQVETILGLPFAGKGWVDGHLVEWVSRTPRPDYGPYTLTLAVPLDLGGPGDDAIPGNTPLLFAAREQGHPDIFVEPTP